MPLPGVTVPLAVFGQMVLKRGITVPTERSPMHSAASRNLVHSAASRNLMHSAASRHPMHSAAAAAAAAAAQNLASHAAKGIWDAYWAFDGYKAHKGYKAYGDGIWDGYKVTWPLENLWKTPYFSLFLRS